VAGPPDRVTRGTITIATERCKGCELCIAACPPSVLAMSAEVNDMGYRYPVLHEGCTGCTACQPASGNSSLKLRS
jgi:2-oxoglutarate ferredoxin oxidoreductase subunit delta